MESIEKEKAAIISGIEADARAEVERILKEAEEQAAEKKKYSEKKVESILNDAREKAEEQAQSIKKKIISEVELEVKRRSMRVRNSVIQDILGRVENKLGAMIDDENYRSVLIGWITEAAIGLGTESIQINASEKERALINGELLSHAAGVIHSQTGRQVELRLSDAQPLKLQGVVLTASDGRTAFNNQVKTRMFRLQREIRTPIYNALFTENRKE